MSDIDFLDNQSHNRGQKAGDKGGKQEEPVWSEPEKEPASPKAPFSFLPFLDKKSAQPEKPQAVDNNKIRQSRQEILRLLKTHETLTPQPRENKTGLMFSLGEKLKKQPSHKEILVDYQQVFNKEKAKRSQVGQIFNAPTAAEKSTVAKPAQIIQDGWIIELLKSIKQKLWSWAESFKKPKPAGLLKADLLTPSLKTALVGEAKPAPKTEAVKAVAPKPELKPIIEEKAIEKKQAPAIEPLLKPAEPELKDEAIRPVIETNLIKGELITYFDWSSKIIILICAILAPIFLVGSVYFGMLYYKKESQIKASQQAQKYADLTQEIKQEEVGLKEITDFQAKLKIITPMFYQHLYWTNFFKFLEDNTIKNVYFSGFLGDTSGLYTLDALAANYNNIAEQVKVFKNNPKIINVSAEGGEMAGGDKDNPASVKFILKFTINKSIFTE